MTILLEAVAQATLFTGPDIRDVRMLTRRAFYQEEVLPERLGQDEDFVTFDHLEEHANKHPELWQDFGGFSVVIDRLRNRPTQGEHRARGLLPPEGSGWFLGDVVSVFLSLSKAIHGSRYHCRVC